VLFRTLRYLKTHGIKKTLERSSRELQYIYREGLIHYFSTRYNQKHYISSAFFDDNNYRIWVEKNEPGENSLHIQHELSKKFKLRPKISIVTPVFNPDRKVFIEMMESVMNQTYENWELCLADASSEPHIREIIEKYVKNDAGRIKVKYLAANKGIAVNSNEALSLASGEFIVLLDHDDMLAPFTLFEIVKTINEYPDVELIYSDRDIISYNGKRLYPFFKPDWSPDYLLTQNYLCHVSVFTREIMNRVGGFREGYDGSQDYDLFLRITECTDKIIHIPKILYHWRILSGSASVDPQAKPYAYESAIQALKDALHRRGLKGTVTHGLSKGFYDVSLTINNTPKVSIIIHPVPWEFLPVKAAKHGVDTPKSHNLEATNVKPWSGVHGKEKMEALKSCIYSIGETTYKNYEIIFIANQEEKEKILKYHKDSGNIAQMKFIQYEEPFHFSVINNYAASKIDTDYFLFLAGDTEIVSIDCLELMLGFAQREETGAVGAKLVYPDNTIKHAGLIFQKEGNIMISHYGYPGDHPGYNGQIQSAHNVSAVSGDCMMVRKEVFDKVGGFDARFDIYGDIDFCLKLREMNYLIVYQPHAELLSYSRDFLSEHVDKDPKLSKEKELFVHKWDHILKKGDPYYNPNLNSERADFSINI
jgi:GT2 family glycosyltransferase